MTQTLANGIIDGATIAVLALSFGLIYNTLRVFHFAFGALYAVAAYAFAARLSWAGLLIAGSLGVLIEWRVYAPLARRRAPAAVTFISSLGVYIMLVNLIALVFGNESKILSEGVRPTISFGTIVFTDIQLWICLVSVMLIFLCVLTLHRTSAGAILRAVGDNIQLSRALGLNVPAVRYAAIFVGTILAGSIAILKGLDVGIDPYIGMSALLTAAVAYIISGGKNYVAMVLGGLVLGLLRNLAVWFFSAQWSDALTFLFLLSILVFRQRGLMADSLRLEEL